MGTGLGAGSLWEVSTICRLVDELFICAVEEGALCKLGEGCAEGGTDTDADVVIETPDVLFG